MRNALSVHTQQYIKLAIANPFINHTSIVKYVDISYGARYQCSVQCLQYYSTVQLFGLSFFAEGDLQTSLLVCSVTRDRLQHVELVVTVQPSHLDDTPQSVLQVFECWRLWTDEQVRDVASMRHARECVDDGRTPGPQVIDAKTLRLYTQQRCR